MISFDISENSISEEPTEEPIEEPTKEPTEESTEEPIEEPTEEFIEESGEESSEPVDNSEYVYNSVSVTSVSYDGINQAQFYETFSVDVFLLGAILGVLLFLVFKSKL